METWVYAGITVNWKYILAFMYKHGFVKIDQYIMCTYIGLLKLILSISHLSF